MSIGRRQGGNRTKKGVIEMSDQMQVAFAASRNLYPYLGPCYVSLLEHNPDAKVWFFIEDDRLPYETFDGASYLALIF